MRGWHWAVVSWCGLWMATAVCQAGEFKLELRFQKAAEAEPSANQDAAQASFTRATRPETWDAKQTAVIVCDVWDAHHCLNAVRRLEEFAPRMDQFLAEARQRGATIIHAPSDCMPAYADHPARKRAMAAPKPAVLPADIQNWCSRIPAEERAVYPIDQSDGGEDDDPAEHAAWRAKLAAQGRNPKLPWKKQLDVITIDSERDYISDRGDEVWAVLESRGIKNVMLVGVHTNMCVLGRPFGLRQMVQNGKRAVLVRDLTDCMYNPERWPYVNHFTGLDLIVSHIERYVCPTITSDQVLGGEPFRSRFDARKVHDVMEVAGDVTRDRAAYEKDWRVARIPAGWEASLVGALRDYEGPAWYRCSLRLTERWLSGEPVTLRLARPAAECQAWWNGKKLEADSSSKDAAFRLPVDTIKAGEIGLLVMRIEHPKGDGRLKETPSLASGKMQASLRGRWQVRIGDDPSWSGIPLPAQFGAGTDILFEVK